MSYTSLTYRSQEDSIPLSRFCNQVYAWMSAGLAVTGISAYVCSQSQAALAFLSNGWGVLGLVILQLILVGTIAGLAKQIGRFGATVLFLAYAALNGLMLSTLLLVYAQSTIASAFFITAGTFAACSVYGMVTKRDLTSLGAFAFMALIGLIIAMVVNVFIANSVMDWIINIIGVLVFVVLTAYDTQKLKDMARDGDEPINGSLSLYLDFINLFLFILKLVGGGKGKD